MCKVKFIVSINYKCDPDASGRPQSVGGREGNFVAPVPKINVSPENSPLSVLEQYVFVG